jgi:hypothetical protein
MKQVEQITHMECSLRCVEISEAVCVAGNTEDGFLCPFSFCYERWKSSHLAKNF